MESAPKIFRKMASIKKIDEVKSIVDCSDKELALIGGWNTIIAKGTFKQGDSIIFCEIDGFVPKDLVTDLDQESEVFLGISGYKIKTYEFKGQVIQGYILPLSTLDKVGKTFELGEDVSAHLGIKKWLSEEELELTKTTDSSNPKVSIPTIDREPLNDFIPKTDQERIQNLASHLESWRQHNLTWEVSEKVDGSSMTVYFKDGVFGVCSRNQDIPEGKGNMFWNAANEGKLKDKLTKLGRNIALQGELLGGKIQGNRYKVKKNEFYLFDIFDIDKQLYLGSKERQEIAKELKVNHVPVLEVYKLKEDETAQSLVEKAEGPSFLLDSVMREGLVFKCLEEQISFKAISNSYLLEKEKQGK